VQDNSVIHVFKDKHPTVLADHVTVGHSATLHGCRIDSYCLIGMGATILNDAHVGEECIIAAGTLIPEGMVVPPRSLVMGTPGKFRRQITEEERQGLRQYAANYYDYKETYLAEAEGR
jgi:carbonic anhydrase/acetyltransferase-like protein (isoleucine patch superfamily)